MFVNDRKFLFVIRKFSSVTPHCVVIYLPYPHRDGVLAKHAKVDAQGDKSKEKRKRNQPNK
jgi:hypothetical protein